MIHIANHKKEKKRWNASACQGMQTDANEKEKGEGEGKYYIPYPPRGSGTEREPKG